jgi:hypothetical protein
MRLSYPLSVIHNPVGIEYIHANMLLLLQVIQEVLIWQCNRRAFSFSCEYIALSNCSRDPRACHGFDGVLKIWTCARSGLGIWEDWGGWYISRPDLGSVGSSDPEAASAFDLLEIFLYFFYLYFAKINDPQLFEPPEVGP